MRNHNLEPPLEVHALEGKSCQEVPSFYLHKYPLFYHSDSCRDQSVGHDQTRVPPKVSNTVRFALLVIYRHNLTHMFTISSSLAELLVRVESFTIIELQRHSL